MQVLVLGATGATGRLLAAALLERSHSLRAVVRSKGRLPPGVAEHPRAAIAEASVLDLPEAALASLARGCDAIVSCLGHRMSARGIFGSPRDLCTDAVRRACEAVARNAPERPARLVLMNTVGVPDPSVDPPRPRLERGVLRLLRHTLPPHRDNETAAAYLRSEIGNRSPHLEWCIVRPDALIDGEISAYDVEPSPTAPLLSGRPTTRANVAHFMAELVEDADLWARWCFRSPVVMNAAEG